MRIASDLQAKVQNALQTEDGSRREVTSLLSCEDRFMLALSGGGYQVKEKK